RESEELDSSLLACCDSLPLRGIAREAERSTVFGAESSAPLHERRVAQLDVISETRGECRLRARDVPQRNESRPAGQHWRIRVCAQAGRADRRAYDEGSVPSGTPGARAASYGPHGIVQHNF